MPKILIVDDDPIMHALYRGVLQKAGHEVSAATDGHDLQNVCASLKPDLVLLDVMMPQVDGISALRILKKGENKAIPVIIITGLAKAISTFRQEAAAAGAGGFLTKPFSPQQLAEEVKKFLP